MSEKQIFGKFVNSECLQKREIVVKKSFAKIFRTRKLYTY